MKVKDLIEELKKIDPDMEVFIWNYAHSEPEYMRGYIYVEYNEDYEIPGCVLK